MIATILQILTAIGMVLFIVFLLRELLFPGFGENEKEKEDEREKRD
jgi:flagellar biogenesis protein FliO